MSRAESCSCRASVSHRWPRVQSKVARPILLKPVESPRTAARLVKIHLTASHRWTPILTGAPRVWSSITIHATSCPQIWLQGLGFEVAVAEDGHTPLRWCAMLHRHRRCRRGGVMPLIEWICAEPRAPDPDAGLADTLWC